MTVTFIPGKFESAHLHHDGNGNWFFVINVAVDLEKGTVLHTHVKLTADEVRRHLLSKVMSITEGL